MAKSRCARCGQSGHWARTCTNEPDARGKANPAKRGLGSFVIGSVPSSYRLQSSLYGSQVSPQEWQYQPAEHTMNLGVPGAGARGMVVSLTL